METNDFIVFPNPFVNEFTISLHANQNEVSSIDLLDLQGKLVSKQMIALNQGLNKLPITNLSQVQAGIYFLRVSHNGTVQIKKIVKN
jgi:DTW domain-containing protein YfiP